MFTQSLWNSFSGTTDFPVLTRDLEVDVAIIGGGITGITTAQLLSKAGLKVAVLESRKVGGGTTSHSTGNLYYTIDQILSTIKSKYDNEIVRKVVASRNEAINLIEKNINSYDIDCDFKRVPWYLYAADDQNKEKIEQEIQTSRDAGVEMTEAREEEIPFKATKTVKVEGQAYFNAMRYVQGLANAIESTTCQIFENSRVHDVEENEEGVTVKTLSGTVKARHAVHATHTPKGVRVMFHTVLGPYREYGVAARLKSGNYPEGIFWGYHGSQKYSVRSYSREGENFIIAVGQPHKVGQAEDNTRHIEKLVSFLQDHFDLGEVTHRWGGQHYKPADKLPYIGQMTGNSRIYIASGFSTDGLTFGTLSGQIISDHISGKENPYTEVYAASRFTPMKSAQDFIKENLNVAAQYIKDLPFSEDEDEIHRLKNGEGKIIEKDGHKVAASRSNDGELSLHSAFCTHMQCVVHWNSAERTWDCPCHGSRFNQEGGVLEGPALHPLKKIETTGNKTDSIERK